jgi:hypothetical protein
MEPHPVNLLDLQLTGHNVGNLAALWMGLPPSENAVDEILDGLQLKTVGTQLRALGQVEVQGGRQGIVRRPKDNELVGRDLLTAVLEDGSRDFRI